MSRFARLWSSLLIGGFAIVQSAVAAPGPYDPGRARGPVRPTVANPQVENRIHDKGKMCMNITNFGYFGNSDPTQDDALTDPCPPGNWASQCEYPCGSEVNYLYQAGLWIGALIVEEGFETKRVSVGTDGWLNPAVNEMYPGEGVLDRIIERSNRPGASNCFGTPVTHPDAVSDQDFIAVYSDTLRDRFWLQDDPIDGPHRPLGIKVTQTSYAFSQAFAEDFILIDYEIENIASNFLKNLFVGLYVDADVGSQAIAQQHTDDVCGFLREAEEITPAGDTLRIPVDVAWIADNDGRRADETSGPLEYRNVTGTRVIRGPNPRLETSFNWWISNSDVQLDYGPTWASRTESADNPMYWTCFFGTPMGDDRKYQVLSNEEFDFDQVIVDNIEEADPQPVIDPATGDTSFEAWSVCDPSPEQEDIANGFDTRYLLSWGPLGIRDYQDQTGRWIYRLNPGEKFNMTIAYVGGENFHDVNRPQNDPNEIDSSLFDFTDLRENARWAKDVYDNRMIDTPQHDWGRDGDPATIDADGSQGDGVLDTGDGWYGEDVGTDGIYIDPPSGFRNYIDSIAVYYWKGTTQYGDGGLFVGYYHGPDLDGTERNGLEDNVQNIYLFAESGGAGSEDFILPEDMYYQHPKLRYWDMGWMSGNRRLDMGDGLPDFTGPPPPPLPVLLHCMTGVLNSASHSGGQVTSARNGDCWIGGLGYELFPEKVALYWSKSSSENPEYVDPFSRVQDFEGYRIHRGASPLDTNFSLLDQFDIIDFSYFSPTDSMMTYPIVTTRPETLSVDTLIEGVTGILKPVGDNTGLDALILNDSTYSYQIPAHALAPVYYSVSAFDFGDPKSGLGSLATRPSANAALLAPAGNANEKVRVVPNPYRAYQDYTAANLGISWENQNDGTSEFYSQQDRRIEFVNLPERCLIRIFTTAGDLVQIVPHNVDGDRSQWASMTSERWDLNSRNRQQVASGIYLFSVEDLTDGNGYQIETGKFVIIR